MRALESKQMLKMSSFGTNTRTQTFAPLINCVINDVLSQAMPHINKMLLQFIQVMNFCLVDPLLHFAPHLVVHWVKIWTIRRPQVWCNEHGCLPFKKFDCVACAVHWSTVLLQDEEVSRDLLHDRQ